MKEQETCPGEFENHRAPGSSSNEISVDSHEESSTKLSVDSHADSCDKISVDSHGTEEILSESADRIEAAQYADSSAPAPNSDSSVQAPDADSSVQAPDADSSGSVLLKKLLRKLSFCSSILTCTIIASALIVLILFLNGIRPYIVTTGSMEPNIHIGSVCFVNGNDDIKEIHKDDVITFRAGDKTIVTHRVIDVTSEGLITRGDANNTEDISPVTEKNYIGKVTVSVPKIGHIMFFLRRKTGRILCVTAIIMLLLFSLMPEPEDEKEKEDAPAPEGENEKGKEA